MKEEIKVQLVELRVRSKEGVKRYSPWLRQKLHPFTFHSLKGQTVRTDEINSQKKMLDFIWRYGGPGTWDLRAPVPNKHAKYGMSMKTIVRATLAPDPRNEWKYYVNQWEEKRLTKYKKILHWEDEK